MATELQLEATMTCPACGDKKIETMPVDACQWYYECNSCHRLLRPLPGDCCVFCSYADVPCPSVQTGDAPCCS